MRGQCGIPTPSTLLLYVFWPSGEKGRRKNLAVACSFKVVVGVRKVCQVSQLYPAIDDLATRELGSMMPSLFTLQAPLVFFFLFFSLMVMRYSPVFPC